MRRNGFVLAMLVLALTFTAVLAGCGGKNDSGGNAGGGNDAASEAKSAKKDEPPPVVEEPKPSEPAPNEADFEIKQLPDNTIEITDYTGSDADLVIPAWLYGLKVTLSKRICCWNGRRNLTVPLRVVSGKGFSKKTGPVIRQVLLFPVFPTLCAAVLFSGFGPFLDQDGDAILARFITSRKMVLIRN
jgi:hypothetical protein